ncbi:hypothetical protein E2I00_009888, partial [Balaenoptera physalus]
EWLRSKGFEWPQTGLWNLDDLICVAYGPISNLNPTTKSLDHSELQATQEQLEEDEENLDQSQGTLVIPTKATLDQPIVATPIKEEMQGPRVQVFEIPCVLYVCSTSPKSSGATGGQRGTLDRAGLDLGRVEGESISGRGGEELVVEIHSDDGQDKWTGPVGRQGDTEKTGDEGADRCMKEVYACLVGSLQFQVKAFELRSLGGQGSRERRLLRQCLIMWCVEEKNLQKGLPSALLLFRPSLSGCVQTPRFSWQLRLEPPIEIKKTLWVSTQGSARWSSSPFLWWEVLAGEDWTSEPAVKGLLIAFQMMIIQLDWNDSKFERGSWVIAVLFVVRNYKQDVSLCGIRSRRIQVGTKILQFLPERIFFRWHYQSIGSTLKKLLHTGNSLKIRCEGIRLFLLWLQALQTNCAEEQVLIFACLVPGFPAIMSSRGPCTLETLINPGPSAADAKIYPEEITPLLPAISGEKITEDQTCFFLQILLKYMVTQAASLEWKHKENQETGFKFLFTLFRKYYLPHLFPSFTKLTNIYKPVLDIPHLRPKPVYVTTTRDSENTYSTKTPYMAARVVFIKWIVTFFLEKKYLTATQNTKNGVDVLPKIIQTVGGGGAVQERAPELDGSGAAEQDRSHSDSSTLSERRLSSCSVCGIEEEHRAVYEMVQRILLSTRGYVNFVNEAFLLPSCDIAVTRKVVQVYRKWILQDKPVFMEEPDIKEVAQEDAEKSGFSETDNKQTSSESSGHKRSSSWGRTYSFTSAVSRGCVTEEENKNVKAGAQAMLQVFLTNAANVFLLEPCVEVPMLLKEQVDACKAVLIIFRRMIMELTMNKKTWEQMLQILLRITEAVMQKPKDKQIKDLFAQSLAGLLFRTLLVAWIRANLCVYISRELWDDFLGVLSSLTDWEELIHEWASIMDSLTVVLARTVYGVEMTNLPLDKLSEQKEKKQRGKGCVPDSQKGTTVGRSFSLSWRSHPDVAEPMRFRSATTSGAPGVEKARNIVRQKATAKRSQSISSCAHLSEALPATKSVPLLLHTVSALFPGLSYTSCSHRLSEVEECPQPENAAAAESGPLAAAEQQPMVRSSSSPDVTEPLCSEAPPGQKVEYAQNVSSSEPRPVQESKGHEKKEHEGITILVRRSSSPAELDLKDDLQQTQGRYRGRQKSDSVSSDPALGCSTEAELSLSPWQICEEDPELSTSTDAVTDSDARHWLQLSPTDASNLTDSSECLADDCSIIAGGTLTGWHPDSAAVLWRRILGILGDVNNIQSPKIHARVFGYLYELWYKLAKATTLPDAYKEGKLQAYKLICAMMTRRQDVLPNSDFLVHFYLIMHLGLTSEDQVSGTPPSRWPVVRKVHVTLCR